jgi:hypothetical protein
LWRFKRPKTLNVNKNGDAQREQMAVS